MRSTILNKLMMLALLTTVSFATEHHVDNTYNGNNSDGSEARPWKTLSDVNALLSDGLHQGDKVLFHKDQTFRGTLKIDNEHNSIEFNSYGDGNLKPIISAYMPDDNLPTDIEMLRDKDYKFALKIDNSSNVTIKKLEFIGMYASILIKNGSKKITLESLKIGQDSLNGIVIGSNPKSDAVIENSNDISEIVINDCNIINEFSKFEHDNTDYSENYNDKEEYMDTLTEDGIVVYAMHNSEISDNYFRNWGHASMNINATIIDGNGDRQGSRNISFNKIFGNTLTSPDTAYGGRIVVDQAHHNIFDDNEINDTSVESQLNGHDNNYTNNIFVNTKFSKKHSDHTAVKIEIYDEENIYNNLYKGNEIRNAINGVGLKLAISNSGYAIQSNKFYNNIISDSDGYNNSHIQLEIEKDNDDYDNNIKQNKYKNNVIKGDSEVSISYHNDNISVSQFNSINNQNEYNDEMNNNNKITEDGEDDALNVSDSIAQKEIKNYTISALAGQSVHAILDELSADTDLYVKVGEEPNINDSEDGYDCRSANGETTDESCYVYTNEDAIVYISVHGYNAADYTLTATNNDISAVSLTSGDTVNTSVERTVINYYKMNVPSTKNITATISGLSADADLFIKKGKIPTTSSYDCKSTNGSTNSDSCSISGSDDMEIYIGIYGFREADYTLEVVVE